VYKYLPDSFFPFTYNTNATIRTKDLCILFSVL